VLLFWGKARAFIKKGLSACHLLRLTAKRSLPANYNFWSLLLLFYDPRSNKQAVIFFTGGN